MASKTAALSVEGVGGKTSDNGGGSKVSSPSSKQADRGDEPSGGGADPDAGGEGKSSDSGTAQEGKTSPARDGAAGTGATPAEESAASSGGGEAAAAAPIIIEAGGRRTGPNLVQRFVDFVFRVIHTEMDSFFTEHANKFDQDWEDFNQQGETLEQFQVRVLRVLCETPKAHGLDEAYFLFLFLFFSFSCFCASRIFF
jgi:hypothetical protein